MPNLLLIHLFVGKNPRANLCHLQKLIKKLTWAPNSKKGNNPPFFPAQLELECPPPFCSPKLIGAIGGFVYCSFNKPRENGYKIVVSHSKLYYV
jgi:hypothetical protein